MRGYLIWILLMVCVTFVPVSAQDDQEEPAITRLMEQFVAFNKEHQTVIGWRVQILATTDRRQMERVRSTFDNLYPEYTLDFTHENPFYHLKTGAFLTQQDARPFLLKMREHYTSAFLVSEEIEVADVLNYY